MSGTNVFDVTTRSFVIACLAFVTAGCTARYPESPTPTAALARIQLHFENSHDYITPGGGTATLILYAVNTEGVYESVTSRATWFSTNTGVMQVVRNGSVAGVSSGSAEVIANYQGLSASAPITVRTTAPTLDLVFKPNAVFVGESRLLNARLSGGSRQDVTTRCTWTSSDPRIVTVEGIELTGRAPGTALITAQLDAVTSASFYISVPPIRALP